MKELDQKADEMLRQNGHYADFYRVEKADIHLAIQSVNYTIALLERMDKEIYNIEPYLDEQIEIKKILENRL